MKSPFRSHQQMVRGLTSGAATRAAANASRAAAAPTPDSPAGREYAQLRVQLHDNLRELGEIQSHEARQPKKAEFAKAFAPWIDGVLEAGASSAAAQDEILVTNMIWAIDYQDFAYALRLGEHAIRHKLDLPERYSRSVGCFLAEEIAEAALAGSDQVDHVQLVQLRELVAEEDMPDQVRAKLFKAIGRSFAAKAEAFDPAADNAPAGGQAAFTEEAVTNLKRALDLDEKAGVKKDIEKLERNLAKLREAAAAAADEQE